MPVFGPPKSRAGRRVVDFADLIVPDLRKHLGSVPPGALAFTSPEGTALSNTNFRRRVWGPAVAAVGLEGVLGHDSERAALIYVHSSDKRQRALADAVAKAARAETGTVQEGHQAGPIWHAEGMKSG